MRAPRRRMPIDGGLLPGNTLSVDWSQDMEGVLRKHGAAAGLLLLGICWLAFAAVDGRVGSALRAVGYLIAAVLRFFGIPEQNRKRSRQRLEARYATQAIPLQPADPPRWFSPDNPPGWYLNPASNEPAYWSELGWRHPAST